MFEKLPNEILELIFSYLNFADILLLSHLSPSMQRSALRPTVLRNSTCLIGNQGFQRSFKSRFPQTFKRLKITERLIERLSGTLNYVSVVSTRGWCDLDYDMATLLFPKLVNVVSLDLLGNQNVNDDFVRVVISNCKNLKQLNISHCSKLTQKSLFMISRSNLELNWLDVSSTQCLTNKAWVSLFWTD